MLDSETLNSRRSSYPALGWPRNPNDKLFLGTSEFPDWIYLLRGTRGLIDLSGIPDSGPLQPIFTHSGERYMQREEASDSRAHAILAELDSIIASRPAVKNNDNLRNIYATAIAELRKSFGHAELTSSGSTGPYEMIDAFIWVYMVAEDLLPLLRTGAREAVAIFAYFCVLLGKLEGHWWMQGWGLQLVGQAYDMLDEEGRLWIAWATDEMGFLPPPALGRM